MLREVLQDVNQIAEKGKLIACHEQGTGPPRPLANTLAVHRPAASPLWVIKLGMGRRASTKENWLTGYLFDPSRSALSDKARQHSQTGGIIQIKDAVSNGHRIYPLMSERCWAIRGRHHLQRRPVPTENSRPLSGYFHS